MVQRMEEIPRVLLTRREAAEFLRVSVSTVQRLYEKGEIRAVHVGRQVRIPRADLERIVRGEAPAHDPGPAAPEHAEDLSTWPPTPSLLSP